LFKQHGVAEPAPVQGLSPPAGLGEGPFGRRRRSQFVIATHSPIIMAYPDASIYSLGADGIKPMAYEDAEHYRVTQAF
jgi:hypothetical protein